MRQFKRDKNIAETVFKEYYDLPMGAIETFVQQIAEYRKTLTESSSINHLDNTSHAMTLLLSYHPTWQIHMVSPEIIEGIIIAAPESESQTFYIGIHGDGIIDSRDEEEFSLNLFQRNERRANRAKSALEIDSIPTLSRRSRTWLSRANITTTEKLRFFSSHGLLPLIEGISVTTALALGQHVQQSTQS